MEREARPSLRRSEDPPPGLAVPQVEHRELRYFVAVAEELHFTNAAQRLEMSQPPLSAAIAHLESKLGTRLFERDSRHVRLTPAGVALLQHARPILRQVQDAVDATRRADAGLQESLRLAADTVSRVTAAPALGLALERAQSSLRVDVVELIPAAITAALLSGEADIGVFVAGGNQPWLGMISFGAFRPWRCSPPRTRPRGASGSGRTSSPSTGSRSGPRSRRPMHTGS